MAYGDAFQRGLIQRMNVGVRGGTDLIRYSFGATQNREEGIVSWNNDERNSIRGNLQLTATENLNIQLSGGYFQNDYQPPERPLGRKLRLGQPPADVPGLQPNLAQRLARRAADSASP